MINKKVKLFGIIIGSVFIILVSLTIYNFNVSSQLVSMESMGSLVGQLTDKIIPPTIASSEINKRMTQGCFANYESWTSSYTLKDNISWNLDLIYTSGMQRGEMSQFIDLNGDNMLDYIYINRSGYPFECVLINTGKGFRLDYKCKVAPEYNSNGGLANYKYYGDCAQ